MDAPCLAPLLLAPEEGVPPLHCQLQKDAETRRETERNGEKWRENETKCEARGMDRHGSAWHATCVPILGFKVSFGPPLLAVQAAGRVYKVEH